MNINEGLLKRKATRAFLDKAVSLDKIRRILEVARFAPSGTNTQPWQVAVVYEDKQAKINGCSSFSSTSSLPQFICL